MIRTAAALVWLCVCAAACGDDVETTYIVAAEQQENLAPPNAENAWPTAYLDGVANGSIVDPDADAATLATPHVFELRYDVESTIESPRALGTDCRVQTVAAQMACRSGPLAGL